MIRNVICGLFVAAVVSSTPSAGQDLAKLGAIRVAGHSRYTEPQVVSLSGLEPGRSVSKADLEAAAQRLADTGLFQRVSYKYATAAGQLTVTFDIEEARWTVPVVLDNFIWFQDDELKEKLRTQIPSFDGTAPDSDQIPDLFKRSLQNVLAERKLPGRVDFTLHTNLRTKAHTFVFAVREPAPPLCALEVHGASAIREEELVSALKRDMRGEYSRFFIQSASAGTLTDMYRERGHWGAEFAVPTAAVTNAAGCDGVRVTLKVNEGPVFTWAGADWKGMTAASPEHLDRLLGMEPGVPIALSQIQQGLLRIRKAYDKQGYLLQTASYVSRLDVAARRARFEIAVDEGPQLKMGVLEISGFPDEMAQRLTSLWKLKPDAVFDGSYPDTFRLEEARGLLGTQRVDVQLIINRERRVVDVKIQKR